MEIKFEEKQSESADSDDNKICDGIADETTTATISLYEYERLTKNKITNLMYTEKEYDMIEQFMQFANDATRHEWQTIDSEIDDFKMEYIDPKYNAKFKGLCIARGTTIINCDPEDLFFGYDDYTKIKELDENCLSVELKHKYDAHRRVISSSFYAPPPAWNREFVFKEIRAIVDAQKQIIHKPKGVQQHVIDVANSFALVEHRASICLGYSINSDECPFEDTIRARHVRCDLQFGGYYFENIGPNQCKAIYLVCMDLKGWIPTWFQNIILPQQSKNILTMKKYIETAMHKLKNSTISIDSPQNTQQQSELIIK